MEEKEILKKVRDLISKMTLEEKIAQLQSVFGKELVDESGNFSEEKAEKLLKNGIGQISRVAGEKGMDPERAVELANKIQKFLKEKTRLGIPAIIHEECLSGFMAKGATVFPQAIGMASTFEPELIRRVSDVIRQHMRAANVHQGLSPVLDIPRDPRWGRTEETFGEDPYLVSRMAAEYVKGLQGEDWREGIIATVKHFTAYGISEGARNLGPAKVGERELREVFLFPFEVAIKEGQAGSLMNAYHEIDGVPCASSKFLLTKILRWEWGFKGYVVSDYIAIRMLENFHRVAKDAKEAAVLALEAGIDIELPSVDCYGEPLIQAVKEGLISEEVINASVERVLRAKFMLGLFDGDLEKDPKKVYDIFDKPEFRELSREVARRSIVLLKNDGILPLSKNIRTVAVIGPNADNPRNLHGDYSYTAHIPSVSETLEGVKIPEECAVRTVSILEGIKNKVSAETQVLYAKGCEILSDSKEGFDEAIEIAKRADVIIAVMGEESGLFHRGISGEGNDRTTLELFGIQRDLLRELHKLGKPIVLVLVNGRPQALKWEHENLNAILEAWYPGEEGGDAVADVIFGDYNPSGKLPISFPAVTGQVPVYYNRKPSAFTDYVEESAKPLYPFGHGLSYTTFEYSNLKIHPEKVNALEKVEISFTIKNTGVREGEEVVQLYVHDQVASLERPVKELKGFKKIHLKPGESKRVTFILYPEQLAFYDEFMRFVVEKGIFEIMIGSSSEDIRLTGTFEVLETKVITEKRKFASEIKVE
ncbi:MULTISPECIES: glycoside hydrolase family 3 N-terminal domain-containing protein [Dictyoglomus]|uniref:Glycoside hydrolase family 3 domain protein n=1 Tax=Dictyoglomus turgidum (strain DSM 6724 / Z-1310) TaxID=515635 RepID=B8E050_DICTD|nr:MULTISPECIES: glycoside hydrolase family 3 N-terminal domain-containing protein [Dictyoglomus]ACK42133.1 glycoside hydrolase family 3 domain protein [Dictyoglomus turgidum DSM 6724]HBU32364.1 beta-glucosidase [Dictyoglomus sp.]